MSKVLEIKKSDEKIVSDFINAIYSDKQKKFIPPKQKMKEDIEHDAKYLMALGGFIEEAQKRLQEYMRLNKSYEASAVNVEIMEAIAKFQANKGLVIDKQTHYDKVFLPMYEKELTESKEKFEEVVAKVKLALAVDTDDAETKKIQGYLQKEFDEYSNSESKEDEEYKNYMYKIFKRLLNKREEIIVAK